MINFTFGQEEEKEQDTTRISYKGKVIIITNESGEDTKTSLKDVEKEEDEKVLVIAPKSDEQDIKKLRQQAIEKFGDAIG